jgi:hypothetical protein
MDRTNSSLKTQAKALRAYLAQQSVELTHSQTLEAVARSHGYKDWNTASASGDGEDGPNLQHVLEFQERLESERPGCEVNMQTIRRQKTVEHTQMQVTVFGSYAEGEHPFAVDEAIRRAGEGTKFWDAFHVAGTGTDPAAKVRDNTFWEGPQPPREEFGKHECECGHYLTRWSGDQHWCGACGRHATIEDGEVASWFVPNHKLEGVSRADEIDEERRGNEPFVVSVVKRPGTTAGSSGAST